MRNDWVEEFAQESERARSLAQRGMFLAGTSVVTVGVLFQAFAAVAGPTVAPSAHAKFVLLVALMCLVGAAITGAFTTAIRQVEFKAPYGVPDSGLAAARAKVLAAARARNDWNAMALSISGWAEVAGMVSIALAAFAYVFNL
jgi:hypothetical protein